MSEYLQLDTEKPHKQDAWVEEHDAQARILKPARPARDEVEVNIRVDRQYRALICLPSALMETTAKREEAIAKACAKLRLGEFIAPNVQVVEVETRFTEARPAVVLPEQKDAQGNITRAESFTPATPEKVEIVWTLRIDGMHLQKVSLTMDEVNQPGWEDVLAGKVSSPIKFSR